MKQKRVSYFSSILVSGALFFALAPLHAQPDSGGPPPVPSKENVSPMPAMNAALHDLEQARLKLTRTRRVFGPHREAAIKACDEAIRQVKAGIKFAEENKKRDEKKN